MAQDGDLDANEAMGLIATSLATYSKPETPAELRAVYRNLSADIFRTAQLIDDSLS